MAEVRAGMATVSYLTGDLPAVRLTVATLALRRHGGNGHAVTVPRVVLWDKGGVLGRLSTVGLPGSRQLGVSLSGSRSLGLGIPWSLSWDSA